MVPKLPFYSLRIIRVACIYKNKGYIKKFIRILLCMGQIQIEIRMFWKTRTTNNNTNNTFSTIKNKNNQY